MNEEFKALREKYQEDFTKLVLEAIRTENIKVTGSIIGTLYDLELYQDDEWLTTLWIANGIEHLKEYGFEPKIQGQENRMKIWDFIHNNLNK